MNILVTFTVVLNESQVMIVCASVYVCRLFQKK